MKKLLFCSIAALSFMLILSCVSTPSGDGDVANTTPAPAEPAQQSTAVAAAAQGPVTDESFRKVYDRYRYGLILDGATTYTVVAGDTLAHISYSGYNNGFYFPLIMKASSDVILDMDKIEPGMVLTVPNLQANLNDPAARANLKAFLFEIADLEEQRHRYQDAAGLRELAASL